MDADDKLLTCKFSIFHIAAACVCKAGQLHVHPQEAAAGPASLRKHRIRARTLGIAAHLVVPGFGVHGLAVLPGGQLQPRRPCIIETP